MSYTLQAFVAPVERLSYLMAIGGSVIGLAQGFGLVPINEVFRVRNRLEWLALLEGEPGAAAEVEVIGRSASVNGAIAYVEAMFWGGDGTQASWIFDPRALGKGPRVTYDAINRALRQLGAERASALDEFEALGLGAHRDTEEWLPDGA